MGDDRSPAHSNQNEIVMKNLQGKDALESLMSAFTDIITNGYPAVLVYQKVDGEGNAEVRIAATDPAYLPYAAKSIINCMANAQDDPGDDPRMEDEAHGHRPN